MAPLRSLVLFFTASTLVSCALAQDANIVDPAVSVDASKDQDWFPKKVHVDSSALWSIEYHKSYKYLVNLAQKQGYILYQRGTAKPAAVNATSDKFVEVPVKSVATYLTTAVPYLDMLGLRDKIAAVEYEEAITSPCVVQNLDSKKTLSINAEDKNGTTQILSNVDVIFQGSFPDNAELNAKSVSTSESQDPGTLNRVEWLEFYSTFFNYEDQANKLTADINNNYNCIAKKSSALSKDTKPVFAWASYSAPSQYNNNTQSWTLSVADYKKQLVEDAGGKILAETAGAETPATTTITFKDVKPFQEALKQADVLVDESFSGVTDIESFRKYYGFAADADLKFLKNKKVYRYDLLQSKSGGMDWLSSGVLMQDAALEDVGNAMHTGLTKDYSFKWFRNLADNVSTKYADTTCKDSKAPLQSYATQCLADGDKLTNPTGSGVSVGVSLLASSALAFVASILVI